MIMICLVLCDYKKMVVKQPKYKHGWLSQHASLRREKAKSSHVIGESSRAAEESSFRGHESPTHDDAPAAFIHASSIFVHVYDPHPPAIPDTSAFDGFPRCPDDMSLI